MIDYNEAERVIADLRWVAAWRTTTQAGENTCLEGASLLESLLKRCRELEKNQITPIEDIPDILDIRNLDNGEDWRTP